MRFITAVAAVAAMYAADVNAQSLLTTIERETRTVQVVEGKKITVTGCLERNPGGGYMLLDGRGDLMYTLVTDKDLTKQLDQFVAIAGRATDLGAAKLKIESKVSGGGITEKATTEFDGPIGLHYLGVDAVDTIAASCAAAKSFN